MVSTKHWSTFISLFVLLVSCIKCEDEWVDKPKPSLNPELFDGESALEGVTHPWLIGWALGDLQLVVVIWVVNIWLDGLISCPFCLFVFWCVCVCACVILLLLFNLGSNAKYFESYIVVSFIHDWFWSWMPIFMRVNCWGCCWIIYGIFKFDWFAMCLFELTTTHDVVDAWNVRASILALTFRWLHM